jgi:hypothetical protein
MESLQRESDAQTSFIQDMRIFYSVANMHACKTQGRSTSGLNSSLVDPPEGVDQT